MAGVLPSSSNCCTDPCVVTPLETLIAQALANLSGLVYLKTFGAAEDGITDDSARVATALASFSSEGGVLVVSGPAAIGSAGILLAGKSNLTILGQGPDAGFVSLATTTLKVPDTTAVGTLIAMTNCTNCSLLGLRIDGAGISNKGIGMEGCEDCTIAGNNVFGQKSENPNVRASIISFGGLRNNFTDNWVHDSTGTLCPGIYVGNTNAGEPEVECIVARNHIWNVAFDGIIGVVQNGTITVNDINTVTASGIAISGIADPGDGRRTTISLNVIKNCEWHGIASDAASVPGTFSDYVTVQGNTIEGCLISGIFAANVRDWSIMGNQCLNNNGNAATTVGGIVVDWAQRVSIVGNTCSDNRAGASRTQAQGIIVVATNGSIADITIIGNTCNNNVLDGILVVNTSPKTIARPVIVGNNCTNNTRYGIAIIDDVPGDITTCQIGLNPLSGNGTNLRNDPTDTFFVQPGQIISTIGFQSNTSGYTTPFNIDGTGSASYHPAGVYVPTTSAQPVRAYTGVTVIGDVSQQANIWSILNNGTARFLDLRTAALKATSLQLYANNAAAVVGGLFPGDFYQVTGSDPRQIAQVI